MPQTLLPPNEYTKWDQWVGTRTAPEPLTQTAYWPGEHFIMASKDEQGSIIEGARIDLRGLWLGKKIWWIRGDNRLKITDYNSHETNQLLELLINKAKKENVAFIRIQSAQPIALGEFRITDPQFLFHVRDPETTLLVDLSQPEETILASMRQKTRYNIRHAEKNGVTVREGTLDEFITLYRATNRRKHLGGYDRDYFEKILNLPAPILAYILIAQKDNMLLAAHLIARFGSTATYLFGGSSNTHRNLMGPHLLHWESMRRAKRDGYAWYDFGGISDTNPAWRDITRFKRGFVSSETGREVDHGKTYDIVLQSGWYACFAFIRRLQG